MKPISVGDWRSAVATLTNQPRLQIAAVNTKKTEKRDMARQQVRQALCHLLAHQLGAPPEAFKLIAQPGQPLRLAPPYAGIGLSLSHEAGLSLLAIHLDGPVGIDLLALPRLALDSDEMRRLATDYLGPAIARQIAAQAATEQPLAFATAWTRHEAGLKCLGLPLDEWQAEFATLLAGCRFTPLRLPNGYVGTVAIQPGSDAEQFCP